MAKHKQFLTFNDGTLCVYAVANIAEPGDRPREGLQLKETLRFAYQTVGLQRHYTAMQAQVEIAELVRVPLRRDISTQDVVVLEGKQYLVRQVQHDDDTKPPVTLLSLERVVQEYDFADIP